MTDSPHGMDDSSEQEVILEIACNTADTLEGAVSLGEEDLLRVAVLTLERVQVEESVEISLLITDDEGLRELNRDFRGRDEATDVLSFPLLDTPMVEAPADQLWQPEAEPSAISSDGQSVWLAGNGTSGENPADAANGATGATGSDADADDEDSDEDVDDNEDGGDFDDSLHLGDIAISQEAVARQAAAAGHSVAWECAYLFVHGLLHLMGYDDSTDAGYRAMVAHQEAVLTEAHITR